MLDECRFAAHHRGADISPLVPAAAAVTAVLE